MALLISLATLLACYWACRALVVRFDLGPREIERSPAVQRLLAGVFSLPAYGLLTWFRFALLSPEVTVDQRPLILAGFVIGGAFVVTWLVAASLTLRTVPGWAWALTLWVAFCGAGAGTALARDANIGLDSGGDREMRATIGDLMAYSTGRKSTTLEYHVRVKVEGEADSRDLELTWLQYRRLKHYDALRMTQHDGAFGWRWIDGIEPAGPSDLRPDGSYVVPPIERH